MDSTKPLALLDGGALVTAVRPSFVALGNTLVGSANCVDMGSGILDAPTTKNMNLAAHDGKFNGTVILMAHGTSVGAKIAISTTGQVKGDKLFALLAAHGFASLTVSKVLFLVCYAGKGGAASAVSAFKTAASTSKTSFGSTVMIGPQGNFRFDITKNEWSIGPDKSEPPTPAIKEWKFAKLNGGAYYAKFDLLNFEGHYAGTLAPSGTTFRHAHTARFTTA